MLCECVFCCKQKASYGMRISDWSADVCSSDLGLFGLRLVIGLVLRVERGGRAKGERQGDKRQTRFHICISPIAERTLCSARRGGKVTCRFQTGFRRRGTYRPHFEI